MTSGPSATDFARRVDRETGVVEDAGFFGPVGNRLFGVAYRPSPEARGAVLICPPLLSEFDQSYSVNVALARALAGRGLTAYTLHYRGTGHSDGEADIISLKTIREDIATAVRRVREETAVTAPVVVASRLTALAAASAPADLGARRLVLWEPALEGRRYFREAWRADMMFQINEGTSAAQRENFVEQLSRTGRVDVLGYPIGRKLHDTFSASTLRDELTEVPERLLIVRGGPPGQSRGDLEELASRLVERGCTVDLQALSEPIVWWFQGPEMRRSAQPAMARLIELTADWIAA